ncbi:hypothetical protein M409DRAFT_30511 [Zasmidium cellare ATCC 36951]|uniref:Carrier domain-containing protein n=1 Tax=Zasmidium cellare ATCC 36951 TaxID=1080233 RepID=A0A6A6BW06_ZASCE|nr:uncharacterized protein M409DRAFT_30511 [Zasmidium cellare ATCC 36951]KAF2158977.1 hypothetical protein M409DRAFT_30511 [Zasmidium cellare ATCC 36951]
MATRNEPIAIVGSACRFAGDATSPSKLWQLIREPRDVRRRIPASRFSADGFYHQNHAHHGHSNVAHSYLLDQDVSAFDAEFFSINAMESQAMDPQQRLLLETVYESLENGGISIDALRDSDTAVYAGVMGGDYEAMLLRDLDLAPTYFAVGTSRAILSNRISYFFNWHGASMTIDTACSSSLVAVHQAVQTLRAGDSRVAIACGANLILGPESYIIESKVRMLSPDGLSRMWDQDANGYARGDGVGALVLKTLSSAVEDGDNILCVIRETAVNQDGATGGITMPSATAQRSLMQKTYAKAGLDLENAADRPQYFEAHGTGTPAGDPIEAEAISSTFGNGQTSYDGKPLYVGSLKTVLGHTEGTAGIAAVMKAALAIQHSIVPPNLLFEKLNPKIAPFYDSLQIPTTASAWPTLPAHEPRRASVNSFGFGGTNAHAILESYQTDTVTGGKQSGGPLTPFVFSAGSGKSLVANLNAFAEYLALHPDLSMSDLAYTLRQRRSIFSHRISFPATSSPEILRERILGRLEASESGVGHRNLLRAGHTSRILGIFTGQGAQYAAMGSELLHASPRARAIIDEIEAYLKLLPSSDRPSWSLVSELLAPASQSRIGEAAISQPLCTAVQIMLVDLLQEANVRFHAVVGHSSGEIAAAYAAGFLTAKDAMYIAYYRGLHCARARSPNGDIAGAMFAVGTSWEDALELCRSEDFAGRVDIAAVNSSSSLTLSGDVDAIEEMQLILEDEGKFHRRLRVDQAYHSTHMQPCLEEYVASLKAVRVTGQTPPKQQCAWFSSVRSGERVDQTFQLGGQYWAENMGRPVLFSQALTAALSSDITFDVALEVGSHAALQAPAMQVMEEVLQKSLQYQGTLVRGNNAVEAFSASLGFLWTHLDKASIHLAACETAMLASQQPQRYTVLQDLPSYRWNHEGSYWHESRRSRKMRLRQAPFHPLLGHTSPDSAPHHLRWKNILKPSEISWLPGHQVQTQTVFPAAGYACTAIEAARRLVDDTSSLRLIELADFQIHQAVVFESEDAPVEVLIELSHVHRPQKDEIVANFLYSAASGGQNADFVLAAQAEVKVFLGDASSSALPEREPTPPHLIPVEQSRLYGFMESMGYNFTGPFRSLDGLSRKLGKAQCMAVRPDVDDVDSFLIHPVTLDAAFQSVLLAYSYPGDDQLRNLHLPTGVAKIRVNPSIFAQSCPSVQTHDAVDSTCGRLDRATPGNGFSGSVNIYTNECTNAAVQADRVHFKPLGASAAHDRNVFYKMDWTLAAPDGHQAAEGIPVTDRDVKLLWTLSRIASYFLRQFDSDVPEDSPARSEAPLCHYLRYARHMTQLLGTGKHQYGKQEWMQDTIEDVLRDVTSNGFEDNSDVQIMLLVGNTMPRVFTGETTMLEHFRSSGLLDQYYAHGFGTMQSSRWLAQTVKQITDRHPHLSILEVGAGTGGATKNILKAIDQSFDRLTFTDVSSSFFENAAEIFSSWRERMVFKVLDAEKDPLTQGFEEGGYDVVVASLVVHATAQLDKTMRNLRRLLKPGGFLVIGEGSSDGPLQSGDGFIFGALPGWWLGVDEGRNLSPFVTVPQWDACLKRTGFSGLDTMAPANFLETFGVILFVSQAVDDRVEFIREPLTHTTAVSMPRLAIIGGAKDPVERLCTEVERTLSGAAAQIIRFETLEDVDFGVCDSDTTVLSLSDLDQPVFQDITEGRWLAFRKLFEVERTLVWVTSGRLQDQPYSNMVVGFGRSAVHELEELRLQFIDIAKINSTQAQAIAESLVRYHAQGLEEKSILYTSEPEIIINARGQPLVPRMIPISAANSRYNSIQRPIEHKIDLATSRIELQMDANDYSVRQVSRFEDFAEIVEGSIELETVCTTMSALKTPRGPKYLVLGVDADGKRYLALVSTLMSRFRIAAQSAVPVKIVGRSEEDFLALNAVELITMAILDPLTTGQEIVLHNPPVAIARSISAAACGKQVTATFVTDKLTEPVPSSWIKVPPLSGRSELSHLVSQRTACFAGLEWVDSENERGILASLPPHCRTETATNLWFPVAATEDGREASDSFHGMLSTAVANVQSLDKTDVGHVVNVVGLDDLTSGERPIDPQTVIDWTAASTLPCINGRFARFDVEPMFKPDKTYWLCGMSGALGVSLCDWMIDRGCRYLVLTSRNPKVEPAWIESHRRNGARVEIMSCDVTNESALRAVHKNIVAALPPIVGVLNGAMVLRDVSVRNMEIGHVQDVIRPKVLGSIHLDRIFDQVDLDFFVLMSSINCVIGNVGQANYAAANMGMCGVAGQRRKRGLNATCVNVGAVIGAGYITQSDRQLDLTVAKMAMMHLSEEDFHQIFAEALEAGYVDSGNGPEISTGLLDITPDAQYIPQWYSNPKFARFIVHQTSTEDSGADQSNAASIHDQLQACGTVEDVFDVIKCSFGIKLRKLLQQTTGDDELMNSDTSYLGLDSLISVDIRAWFLKNFQVNIPVLKIMNDDVQMATLVELAVEGIPSQLVPNIGHGSSSSQDESSSNLSSDRVDTTDNTSAATTPAEMPSSQDEAPSGKVYWNAECEPPRNITILPSASPPRTQPSVVLLTGVSGLLGHHLLQTLLNEPSITKVICIAVRRLAERLRSNEIPPPSDRIVYYEGDLSHSSFNLSETQLVAIFSEVDAVIHNGSDTSHLKYYSAVRKSNVESTRLLARHCLTRMIPLHYVSSAGVALFADLDAFPEVSVTSSGHLPSADGSHGYMCGKWVSEYMLEKTNALYGLQVWIHRPSTIIREGDDATTERAEFDWVNTLIFYSHKIRAVPRIVHMRGRFDLVNVHSVCTDIVQGLLNKRPQSAGGVTYVNNVGDLTIPMDQLDELGLEKQEGRPYDVVSIKEWMERVIAAGMHPAVATLIETIDHAGSPPYPTLLKART